MEKTPIQLPALSNELRAELRVIGDKSFVVLQDCFNAEEEVLARLMAVNLLGPFILNALDLHIRYFKRRPHYRLEWQSAIGASIIETFAKLIEAFMDRKDFYTDLCEVVNRRLAPDDKTWRIDIPSYLSLWQGQSPAHPEDALNDTSSLMDSDHGETKKAPRLSAQVGSPAAVRKFDAYLKAKGLTLKQLAELAGTTDRSLRSFRKRGTIKYGIFENLANEMGISKEDFLKE